MLLSTLMTSRFTFKNHGVDSFDFGIAADCLLPFPSTLHMPLADASLAAFHNCHHRQLKHSATCTRYRRYSYWPSNSSFRTGI